MASPKALLCVLGEQETDGISEESFLRASGFGTATVFWKEVAEQRGWMQLWPILNDPNVQAWVFTGHPADFTDELLSRISMLTLALTRPAPPMTAFVLTGSGELPDFPDFLGHLKIFSGNTSFAPRLAAARLKPRTAPPLPFYAVAHLDPLIGQWLEVGPAPGQTWNGFMAGVVGAEVEAFGVGPRGTLPKKSVLNHPQCGIKGEWGDHTFSACAAKNEIDAETACFLRVEGCPRAIFITKYLEEGENGADQPVNLLELY